MRSTRPATSVLGAITALVLATPHAAQVPGTPWFDSGETTYLPDIPGAAQIVAGDFDRDGDIDLVAGRPGVLLRNDGSGKFASDPTAWTAPAQPWSVTALDADGDGDLDLLCGGGQATLFLNDGTGRFADVTATHLPAPASAFGALAFDVDADGDLDVVVPPNTIGDLRLWENDGTGRFVDATATRMPPYAPGRDLAAADFDGDGDTDLAAGDGINSPLFYANDGSGVFAIRAGLPDRLASRTVVAEDFDGDGLVDVFVAVEGRAGALYRNLGNWTFAATSAWPAATPVDGAVAAAWDGDRDGDPDLLVGGRGANAAFRNDRAARRFVADGAVWPSRVLGDTSELVVADLDGDGHDDVVAAGLGHPLQLLLGDGAGHLFDATRAALPKLVNATNGVAIGDLDADGRADAILIAAARIFVVRSVGTGRFGPATTIPIPGALGSRVALGDVDGDGDLDAVVGTWNVASSPPDLLLRNDGRAAFTVAGFGTGTQSFETALADLDRDGDLDLVAATQGGVVLHDNDGTGAFADVTAARGIPAVGAVGSIAVDDLDGDGDVDLLAGGVALTVLLNDGSGAFAPGPVIATSELANAVALGDADGDGDLDALVAGGTVQTPPVALRLFVNDGRAGLTEHVGGAFPGVPAACLALGFIDVDGDGDLDVWREIALNRFSHPGFYRQVLRNDGGLSFVDDPAAAPPRLASPAYHVAFADLDGDGLTDVLSSGLDSHALFSRRRALRVPRLGRVGGVVEYVVASSIAPPGALVAAWFAAGAPPQPIALPPLGRLDLDPASLVAGPIAVLDPNGERREVLRVPADPTLAGVVLRVQALVVEGPSLLDARLTRAEELVIR